MPGGACSCSLLAAREAPVAALIVTINHNTWRLGRSWTSTGGEVDHAGVVTFHKLSDTTSRVAVQIDWKPEGFIEKAGAALDIPDRAVQAELANFKKFIEEQGHADGAWRGTVEN